MNATQLRQLIADSANQGGCGVTLTLSEAMEIANQLDLQRVITDDATGQIDGLMGTITAMKRDMPSIARRKCWQCENVAWHADNRTPYVLCRHCGSQDTRLIKETP